MLQYQKIIEISTFNGFNMKPFFHVSNTGKEDKIFFELLFVFLLT